MLTQIKVIFLQTKPSGLFLDYMCKIISVRIIHARNQITKLFIFFLKIVSAGRIEACGDTKYQNFDSFFEERKNLEQKKFLVNLSDLMSKFLFLRIESIFYKPFPKKTNRYS